jgi:adenosylhomocysteine nucleosidase
LILIFCAFSAELEPLRKRLKATKALNIRGLAGARGQIGESEFAIVASGIGMRRAAENARRAFDQVGDPRHIILTGVAGALVDNIAIGDVILGDRLLTRDGDSAAPGRLIETPLEHFQRASSALDQAGIRHTRGAILTVKYPLATETEKRLAGQHTGAIAVDMETAVIAFEAAARGIPFIAMRTIMDTVEHDVAGAGLADENGKVRPLKAAATLVRNPAMVAGVIRLVRNLRKASDAMAVAVEVVARHFE